MVMKLQTSDTHGCSPARVFREYEVPSPGTIFYLCFMSESSQNGTVLLGGAAYPALEEMKSALEVTLCFTLDI